MTDQLSIESFRNPLLQGIYASLALATITAHAIEWEGRQDTVVYPENFLAYDSASAYENAQHDSSPEAYGIPAGSLPDASWNMD